MYSQQSIAQSHSFCEPLNPPGSWHEAGESRDQAEMGEGVTICEANERDKTRKSLPKAQVVVTGKVVMEFDPILEGLHGRVSQAEGSVILLAELRVGVLYGSDHREKCREDWCRS